MPPTQGRVELDGTSISDLDRSWRDRAGYVPQEVAVFDGTVGQNVALTWRDDYDHDRAWDALRVAQLDGIVRDRTGGLDGAVGDRGLSLSGGQRQRLGIARALYNNPSLLVLDEATSALDNMTEAAINAAITQMHRERTVVLVAHRLSTVRHVDQIFFLDRGRLRAQGTFDELVRTVPDFAAQAALAGITGITGVTGVTLILVLSDITRDPRVLKQVRLFAGRYAVTTCSFGEAPDGVVEHISLGAEARGWPNDKAGLALRRHDHVYWSLPAVEAARTALQGLEFDAVIANDLNTVPLATTVRSRGGFHADLHEYAPAEKDNELAWRLLVAPYQRHLLRRYAAHATSATTVSQGIADAYRRNFGLDCAVVANAAPYQDRTPQPVHTPMRAIFTGAAQAARHVDLMIEAMREVPQGLTLDLYLMPNEPDYLAALQSAADEVSSVRILPAVPFAELMDTVASYDIALAFQRPTTFNIKYAVPNKFFEAIQARTAVVVGKFFEAIQARTAVVVGPAPELEAVVRKHGFGVVTSDFTAEALAETLRGLTPERVATLKAAADGAAYDLSAERAEGPWVTAVDTMAATARR